MTSVDPEQAALQAESLIMRIRAAEAKLRQKYADFEDEERARANAFHREVEPEQAGLDALYAELTELAIDQQAQPVRREIRDFATQHALLWIETAAPMLRATDPQIVMDMARRLGITRTIATPQHGWQYDPVKFARSVTRDPKLSKLFADYIIPPTPSRSLHILLYSTFSGDPATKPEEMTILIKEPAPR